MMSKHLSCVVFSVFLLACAGDNEDSSDAPQVTLPHQYRLYAQCRECSELTLHRSAERLELRAHAIDGGFRDLSTGSLSAQTYTELIERLDALDDGEQALGELPRDVPLDLPRVELWLTKLSLSFAHGYPPAGLEQVDALLWAVLDDLSRCQTSEHVTPDTDCVPLADDLW